MEVTCNYGMTLKEFKAIPVKSTDDPEIKCDFNRETSIIESRIITDKITGLVLREVEDEFKKDKTIISRHSKSYRYYKDGRLYRIEEIFKQGKHMSVVHNINQTFFYDSEGRVTEEVTEDSEGTVIKSYCYEVDSNGNVTSGMNTKFYPNDKEEEINED